MTRWISNPSDRAAASSFFRSASATSCFSTPGTSSQPTWEARGVTCLRSSSHLTLVSNSEYEPRYIPAWSGEAGNHAASDRVAHRR